MEHNLSREYVRKVSLLVIMGIAVISFMFLFPVVDVIISISIPYGGHCITYSTAICPKGQPSIPRDMGQ